MMGGDIDTHSDFVFLAPNTCPRTSGHTCFLSELFVSELASSLSLLPNFVIGWALHEVSFLPNEMMRHDSGENASRSDIRDEVNVLGRSLRQKNWT